jgi:hypothetical protein
MNIPLTTVCARLERAIHADVGMKGLKILLYGWRMKQGMISKHTFSYRADNNNGVPYLTTYELHYFSRYCGYDLTHD